MKQYKENREAFPATKEAEMHKLNIRKGKVIIEFGQKAKDDEVNVISSVWIDPAMLPRLIYDCINVGIAYQKKYDQDIGFSRFIEAAEAKKESTGEV